MHGEPVTAALPQWIRTLLPLTTAHEADGAPPFTATDGSYTPAGPNTAPRLAWAAVTAYPQQDVNETMNVRAAIGQRMCTYAGPAPLSNNDAEAMAQLQADRSCPNTHDICNLSDSLIVALQREHDLATCQRLQLRATNNPALTRRRNRYCNVTEALLPAQAAEPTDANVTPTQRPDRYGSNWKQPAPKETPQEADDFGIQAHTPVLSNKGRCMVTTNAHRQIAHVPSHQDVPAGTSPRAKQNQAAAMPAYGPVMANEAADVAANHTAHETRAMNLTDTEIRGGRRARNKAQATPEPPHGPHRDDHITAMAGGTPFQVACQRGFIAGDPRRTIREACAQIHVRQWAKRTTQGSAIRVWNDIDPRVSVSANWSHGPCEPFSICHTWAMGRCHTQNMHRNPALHRRLIATAQLDQRLSNDADEENPILSYADAETIAETCPICPPHDPNRRLIGHLHEHPLQHLRQGFGTRTCDQCTHEITHGWVCVTCDVDYCVACYQAARDQPPPRPRAHVRHQFTACMNEGVVKLRRTMHDQVEAILAEVYRKVTGYSPAAACTAALNVRDLRLTTDTAMQAGNADAPQPAPHTTITCPLLAHWNWLVTRTRPSSTPVNAAGETAWEMGWRGLVPRALLEGITAEIIHLRRNPGRGRAGPDEVDHRLSNSKMRDTTQGQPTAPEDSEDHGNEPLTPSEEASIIRRMVQTAFRDIVQGVIMPWANETDQVAATTLKAHYRATNGIGVPPPPEGSPLQTWQGHWITRDFGAEAQNSAAPPPPGITQFDGICKINVELTADGQMKNEDDEEWALRVQYGDGDAEDLSITEARILSSTRPSIPAHSGAEPTHEETGQQCPKPHRYVCATCEAAPVQIKGKDCRACYQTRQMATVATTQLMITSAWQKSGKVQRWRDQAPPTTIHKIIQDGKHAAHIMGRTWPTGNAATRHLHAALATNGIPWTDEDGVCHFNTEAAGIHMGTWAAQRCVCHAKGRKIQGRMCATCGRIAAGGERPVHGGSTMQGSNHGRGRGGRGMPAMRVHGTSAPPRHTGPPGAPRPT